MNTAFRHIVNTLILAAYLTVGVVGYLQPVPVFGALVELLMRGRQNPPSPQPAAWTQQKHIPAAEKVNVPDAVAVPTPIPPRCDQPVILPSSSLPFPSFFSGIRESSPRSPPPASI